MSAKTDKKELTVTGLVALSDYSALFSNSSDMMFDAVSYTHLDVYKRQIKQ